MSEVLKTVDECCEKALKMMDKPLVEQRKEADAKRPDDASIDLQNGVASNRAKEEEFNKVRKIDKGLLNGGEDEERKKEGAVVEDIKLNFSGISEIKGNNGLDTKHKNVEPIAPINTAAPPAENPPIAIHKE